MSLNILFEKFLLLQLRPWHISHPSRVNLAVINTCWASTIEFLPVNMVHSIKMITLLGWVLHIRQ